MSGQSNVVPLKPTEEQPETHPLPAAATKQLALMDAQIKQLQVQLQMYARGVLSGLGVDTDALDVQFTDGWVGYQARPAKKG